MRAKAPHMIVQLHTGPEKLMEIAHWIDGYCIKNYEKEIVITRVWDTVQGESGVHPDKRAFDFRDEWFDGKNTRHYWSDEERKAILDAVSQEYKRDDGKPVIISHSFNGGALHFHVQIPTGWVK